MSNERIIMLETGSPVSSQEEEGPAFILKNQALAWLRRIITDDDDVRKLEDWKKLFDGMREHNVSFDVNVWMCIFNDDIIGPYTKQKYPLAFDSTIKALPVDLNGYPRLLSESSYKYYLYVNDEWIEEERTEEEQLEDAAMEELIATMDDQIKEAVKYMDEIEYELGEDSL